MDNNKANFCPIGRNICMDGKVYVSSDYDENGYYTCRFWDSKWSVCKVITEDDVFSLRYELTKELTAIKKAIYEMTQ